MTIPQIKAALGAAFDALVKEYRRQNIPTQTLILGPNQQAIKTAIHLHVNTHITLDPSVPPDLGCAEAVSFILNAAGVPNMPETGFAGTAALYQFLQGSTTLVSVTEPLPYDVIISPTGTSAKGSPHGHVGIVGENGMVYSNDSNTGLFRQNYSLDSWKQYFGNIEGFPQFYFRWA